MEDRASIQPLTQRAPDPRYFDVYRSWYDRADHKVYNRLVVGGFDTWMSAARQAREMAAAAGITEPYTSEARFTVEPCEHKNLARQHGAARS